MRIFLLILSLLLPLFASAQNKAHLQRTQKNGLFVESFSVLKSDTSVRDGKYELRYKNWTIESGSYRSGKKVGTWTYRNYNKQIELMYNYTLRQPVHILQHLGKTYDQNNYPCMFLGSPVIPYFFVLSHVYYPKAEENNRSGGSVVLTILVDKSGQMKGYKIKEATSENFARVVRQAADKISSRNWRWIPALADGKEVDGEYDITIEFDN